MTIETEDEIVTCSVTDIEIERTEAVGGKVLREEVVIGADNLERADRDE